MTTRWGRHALGLLLMGLIYGACTKVYYDRNAPGQNTSVSPTSPTPPAIVKDLIEFRIFGNVGLAPTSIKFTNTVDGLTIVPSAGLPYVASVNSVESSVFLYVEAQATPLTIVPGTLQVQIYVNGRLFREGYATGLSTIVASASGTFRR